MHTNTLKKKIIIIFLIIAILVAYILVFDSVSTPTAQAVEESVIFNYTGGVQSFTAPQDGIYKLEVWGASGGDNTRRFWRS